MHISRSSRQNTTSSIVLLKRWGDIVFGLCALNGNRGLPTTDVHISPSLIISRYHSTSPNLSISPTRKLGNMAIPESMKAVILKESYTVAVEDVPTPKIKEDGDVLVKVHLAGLCGTSPLPYNFKYLT
jgi:hypothetical protein